MGRSELGRLVRGRAKREEVAIGSHREQLGDWASKEPAGNIQTEGVKSPFLVSTTA